MAPPFRLLTSVEMFHKLFVADEDSLGDARPGPGGCWPFRVIELAGQIRAAWDSQLV